MASEAEQTVETWLNEQGFAQYAGLFAENAIDFDLLPTLSEADLRSIGIPFGHARKLAGAAAALAQAQLPAQTPLSPSAVEPERRQLTVMFCDLVGSTALSSRLDPEDLRDIIQRYQKACAVVVDRYGGFVAQYLGDGILVYFGYPQAQEDAAERAVRTGLEIIAAVDGLSTPTTVKIQVRIGVATGLAVVGDLIGQGSSEQAAVIGQTPNLAARIQALAEPGCMAIAESTRKLVGNLFEYRELGPQRLKGIDEAVRVALVLGERRHAARFESIRSTRHDCIGRSRELDFLESKWRRARSGDGQVVLAWGEAGIGKSRLLRLLNEKLEGESLIRIHAQCSPQHGATPLYPVIHANQRVMGFKSEDSTEARLDKIERFLALGDRVECAPLLAALMSVPYTDRYPAVALSAEEQKDQTLQMCVDFVLNLAARQPVLYQVEDAHWMDPTTEEMLVRLAERIADCRVFLLVTGRPECRPSWLGQPHVSLLDLGRLGEAEIRLMVRDIAAGKELPEEVMAQILAKTDGVPLFVEELTRNVLESGLLRDEGASWVLDGSLPQMAIPSTLQDSLMARLDRLSSAKEVVQVAAAIGRNFSYAMLRAVLDYPEAQLRSALDRLFRAGLVFHRGEPPESEYWFKHALVQDAAYESLLKSRRTLLHTRILRALETHFPELVQTQPEVLAHHALRADLIEKAIHYGLQAGRQALAHSANREAIQSLRQAIALIPSLADAPSRLTQELDLQLALGQAELALHGYAAPQTAEPFERAQYLAQQVNDPQQFYSVLYGLWATNVINGRLVQASDLARRFLERADQDPANVAFRCIGHRMVGNTAFYDGKLEFAQTHLHRAIALYDMAQHRELALRFGSDIGVAARIFLGWIEAVRGRPETAASHFTTAVEQAETIGHALSMGQVLHVRCLLPVIGRDYPATLKASQRALAYSEKHNLGYFRFWARNFQALAEANLSSPEKLFTLRSNLPGMKDFNQSIAVWWFHSWVAEVLLASGKPQEAMEELKLAFDLVAVSGEGWGLSEIERIHGECLLALVPEDSRAAEGWLRRALGTAQAIGALMFELRAALSLYRLLAAEGRRDEGQCVLATTCAQFTEGGSSLQELRTARLILLER